MSDNFSIHEPSERILELVESILYQHHAIIELNEKLLRTLACPAVVINKEFVQ